MRPPTKANSPADQARATQDTEVPAKGRPPPHLDLPLRPGRDTPHRSHPWGVTGPGSASQGSSTTLPGAGRDAGPGAQVPPLQFTAVDGKKPPGLQAVTAVSFCLHGNDSPFEPSLHEFL